MSNGSSDNLPEIVSIEISSPRMRHDRKPVVDLTRETGALSRFLTTEDAVKSLLERLVTNYPFETIERLESLGHLSTYHRGTVNERSQA